MNVLTIDPGPEQSAFMLYDALADKPLRFGKIANGELVVLTREITYDHAVIEMIASYGMSVGRETFETVFWIGRFYETILRTGAEPSRMYRLEVKQHLCHDSRAKDSNIRQSLLDRFGPGKALACGTVANKGPLYGVSKDVWSALALAVTWSDKHAGVAAEVTA